MTVVKCLFLSAGVCLLSDDTAVVVVSIYGEFAQRREQFPRIKTCICNFITLSRSEETIIVISLLCMRLEHHFYFQVKIIQQQKRTYLQSYSTENLVSSTSVVVSVPP